MPDGGGFRRIAGVMTRHARRTERTENRIGGSRDASADSVCAARATGYCALEGMARMKVMSAFMSVGFMLVSGMPPRCMRVV